MQKGLQHAQKRRNMSQFFPIVIKMVVLAALLVGCSDQEASNTEDSKVNKDAVGEGKKNKKEDPSHSKYVNNPQAPDDRSLQKVGQTFEDLDGEITLKAIQKVNKPYLIGPIELMIENVKVLNYYPSPDLIDFFHEFTHHEKNFNYVKIDLAILNTSGNKLNFAPVSYIETNTGEKKSWEEDFYMEGLYGNIEGTQRKQGSLGFVLNETPMNELKSIKIVTSPVFNGEKVIISKEKEITIRLK
jgi:hypothetical protein